MIIATQFPLKAMAVMIAIRFVVTLGEYYCSTGRPLLIKNDNMAKGIVSGASCI